MQTLLKLHKLDSDFLAFLPEHYATLLSEYRYSANLPNKSFLNDIAYYLEAFLAKFFEIEAEVAALQKNDNLYVNLYKCQKNFIVRRVIPSLQEYKNLEKIDDIIPEHIFADQVVSWMADEEKYATELAQAEKYARYMLRIADPESIIFRDISYSYIALEKTDGDNKKTSHKPPLRDAFVIKHAHYCLYCHHRNKDSCSTGLYKKGVIQTNALNNILSGCPLEQKISEMNEAKAAGFSIAALAIITIDNPMVAVTGHRICNDCKKSCIFQNQEPVDVPQIETKILRDVLSLPKGEEIYELLTKWNPLKAEDYLPQNPNERKILIVGMGPAGFSLAYYLLRAGCKVIAIDGSYKFGGVAEYGITSRWDKTFLDLIFKILQNYEHFEFHPGIKFGSNITYNQAKEMGFRKIALCTGAGSPKVLDIPGITAKGVKLAADFLMSVNRIQETDPLIPNIMLRMPIAIIGGGLSAVDAATEAWSYYKVQVTEFAHRFKNQEFTSEEKEIAAEFLSHALILQESDDHLSLMKKWGGVKIYYHRDLNQSAAYRINHEELQYAIDEGIEIIHNSEVVEILTDEYGAAKGMKFLDHTHGAEIICNARSILIAIGISESQIQETKDIYVFGDADPNYEGSVVKAVASAKNGYKRILDDLPIQEESYEYRKLNDFLPQLLSVKFLAADIVEFIIRAPLSLQNFKPGQFFKLQNQYGEFAALNVSEINGEDLSLIMQVKGSATKALSKLKPNDKIYLLGPLGNVPQAYDQKTLIIGEEIANCGLWPIGYKSKHIAILSKQNQEIFREKFEKYSPNFVFIFAEEFEEVVAKEDFSQYDQIIAALSPQNLKILQKYNAKVTTAVHSIMQCMMGGVCGSCLQKNGTNYFYSCQNQYQDLRQLDIVHLQNKLNQNRLIENLYKA
jgi:NADPH-dependent glutamate synthase beta subunit-like oxidoreductase/NAD(P)H-flavin reductase